MVWITEGSLTVGDDWNRSSFTISSSIIRVVHLLQAEQAVHHRGLIALTDRTSGIASLIDTRRMYPTSEAEVFVFPAIVNLDLTGVAVKQFKAPFEYSWSWRVQIDSWVDLDDEIKSRLGDLDQKIESVTSIVTTILGLLA